jgi:Fe-S-cluster containining protein
VGLVRIGAAEADRLAGALGLGREEFVRLYAVPTGRERWRLKDRFVEIAGPDGSSRRREQWCIFLERGEDGLYGCRVNAVKPDQCAGFPARWRNEDTLRTCAGLRRLLSELRAERGPARSGRA